MKAAMTKVIGTLTQEDFYGAFQNLLERHSKWIAAKEDYFDGDLSFMCVLSIKVPIRNKSRNLFNDHRIYIYIHIYIYIYDLSANTSLATLFLNGLLEFICLPSVKWFQVFLSLTNNSIQS